MVIMSVDIIFQFTMNIIADNCPSDKYEFITEEYIDPIHHHFYYGFITKLILCSYCNVIVAVYNEPHKNLLPDVGWDRDVEKFNCKSGCCIVNYKPCPHCIHCIKWR